MNKLGGSGAGFRAKVIRMHVKHFFFGYFWFSNVGVGREN